jgi:SSS family solute:Na+ symporter
MYTVVFVMGAAVVTLLAGILPHAGFLKALELAGATDRLHAIDFRVNLTERYTFWSGIIGGLFLMLSYFGCDQSQVQRYLTAKSIDEARRGLMISAYLKIPLQLLILFTGVLVFVFYLFQTPPLLFNRVHDDRVAASAYAGEYAALQRTFDDEIAVRREAAQRTDRAAFLESDARVRDIRARAVALVRQASGDPNYNDANFVFPTFVLTRMPVGLVGLMIAAIFVASMSSSGGELNALATATIIDFYRRYFVRNGADAHYVRVSKIATLAWGLFACLVAMQAAGQGSLIEVVNRYGSFVYGSLLGVFILAIGTTRATARGAFIGLLAGMAAVLTVAITLPWIEFLWHNLIGAVVVVAVGMAVSYLEPAPAPRANVDAAL